MRSNSFRMAALCTFLLIGSGLAWGSDRPGQGLFLAGKDGTTRVPAPVLGATVEVRMTGIIARTRVTQIFTNPAKKWVEGIYIFPLPEDAAVDTLRMKVGDRTVQGVIQEKGEARQTYETAKAQGVKASLIEQQRPDVFTTAVANIGPGETVEIAVEMQQVVRWDRDHFSLRFPMVVAPRSEGRQIALPPVRRRGAPPINPFAFHADLDPGFPLARVASPSHAVTVAKGKNFRYAVDLKKGVEPADSDFVLEWAPAVGSEPRGVFYSEEVDGERYDLLMVMPPDAPGAVASRLPRETIFIIDTSGSMSGPSIVQAREALLLALDKLQPTDRFNVIRFSVPSQLGVSGQRSGEPRRARKGPRLRLRPERGRRHRTAPGARYRLPEPGSRRPRAAGDLRHRRPAQRRGAGRPVPERESRRPPALPGGDRLGSQRRASAPAGRARPWIVHPDRRYPGKWRRRWRRCSPSSTRRCSSGSRCGGAIPRPRPGRRGPRTSISASPW